MNKLSSEEAYEIKVKLRQGIKQKDLASEYKVSSATITHIKKGITFKYITCPNPLYMEGFTAGYEKCINDLKKLRTWHENE